MICSQRMIYMNMARIWLNVYMLMNDHRWISWQVCLIDCWFFSNLAWFVALWMTSLIFVMWLSFNFCSMIVILFVNLLFINMHLRLARNSFLIFCNFQFFIIYYIFLYRKSAAKKQTQTKQTLKNQPNKEKHLNNNVWITDF